MVLGERSVPASRELAPVLSLEGAENNVEIVSNEASNLDARNLTASGQSLNSGGRDGEVPGQLLRGRQ